MELSPVDALGAIVVLVSSRVEFGSNELLVTFVILGKEMVEFRSNE